jgi:hypothetical protein
MGQPDVLDDIRSVDWPFLVNYRVEASSDPIHTKHRIVWAAPLATQILEATFASTIVAQLSVLNGDPNEMLASDMRHGSHFSYVPAWFLHRRLMHMREEARDRSTSLISGDYTSYDQHLSAELIELSFDALGVPHAGDGLLVRRRFIKKKLHSPWGTRDFIGMVPSGSVFTNLIDSAANAIIIRYLALRLGREIWSRVNGDDFVCIADKEISPIEMESIMGELGIVSNHEKQYISPGGGFLFNKAYWGPEFSGPTPSINKTLNSIIRVDQLVFKVDMNADVEAIRTFQILEGIVEHPARKQLFERLMYAYDKDGILLDVNRVEKGLKFLAEYSGAREWDASELISRFTRVRERCLET